jgi:hypothetical protein
MVPGMTATLDTVPANPTAGLYIVVRLRADRFQVQSWQPAEDGTGAMEWAFLECCTGEDAERDAHELAAYMNAGGA